VPPTQSYKKRDTFYNRVGLTRKLTRVPAQQHLFPTHYFSYLNRVLFIELAMFPGLGHKAGLGKGHKQDEGESEAKFDVHLDGSAERE
jgi:hypothetical protein